MGLTPELKRRTSNFLSVIAKKLRRITKMNVTALKKPIFVLFLMFSVFNTNQVFSICASQNQKAVKAAERGDYESALQIWKRHADKGESGSQYNVGLLYLNLNKPKTAVKYFSRAAIQGDGLAMMNLGVAFARGEGVQRDFIEAYAWGELALGCDIPEAEGLRGYARQNMNQNQLQKAQRLIITIRKQQLESNPGIRKGKVPKFIAEMGARQCLRPGHSIDTGC